VITNKVEEANRRKLGYWFLGTAGLVASMVTIGGITRLTRSGLSMTDWTLQGSLPPISQEEWNKEFERYKSYPEYQQRKSMSLEEFKFIYFWEYSHRMFGRFIGIAFVIPGLYFASRGMIPKDLYPRIALLFGLGGGQGLIGWWMVKSGLEGVDSSQKKEIRVSPYRLATHLLMAFTTYTLLLKTGFNQLLPQAKLESIAKGMSNEVLTVAKKSRKFAIHNAVLAAVTIVTGAFVAGNDAGRAYNTFPKMGDEWIPWNDIWEKTLVPSYRNFFENTALVQLDHRLFALSTLTAVTVGWMKVKNALGGQYWKDIPRILRLSYHASLGMAWVQVGLGITTLLLYVPVDVAATHQAGSLLLLTIMTGLVHCLGFSKYGKGLATSSKKVVQSVTQSMNVNTK
jgi:cytochrome c oxidase assembly protein subunit 15